jgi:hypothetical protein
VAADTPWCGDFATFPTFDPQPMAVSFPPLDTFDKFKPHCCIAISIASVAYVLTGNEGDRNIGSLAQLS